MNFGELINKTASRLRDEGRKDIPGFISSANTFLKLAGLSVENQCTGEILSHQYVAKLRANGEESGTLKRGGSSSWASRVKHLVATWQQNQARNEGTNFNVLLAKAMKDHGGKITTVAKETGVPSMSLSHWLRDTTPAEYNLKSVTQLDGYFKLEGRLVASLAGVKLSQRSAPKVYSQDERTAILAGTKDIHTTTRFFTTESNDSYAKLARQSGLRPTLVDCFSKAEIGLRRVALQPTDSPAFLELDRLTNARGVLNTVFERELNASVVNEKVTFTLSNWPAALRAEYAKFCDYKTVNRAGLDRSEKAKWCRYQMPNGTWCTPSERGWRSAFESIFGYALRTGAIKRPEDLRLAHATVYELVTGFLLDRMKRTGRVHMNHGDSSFLRVIYSLIWGGGDGLNGSGYFANDAVGAEYWSDPYFANLLPKNWVPDSVGGYRIASEPIPIPPEKLANRWQAYLADVSKRLNKFERGQDFVGGDYAECVRDILDNSDYVIGEWFRKGFSCLLTNVPPKHSSPVRWAQHVRKCVLYLFMCTRGFRRSTHTRLELKHIELNSTSRVYMYRFPGELTKTRGKGGSKGGVHAPVDDVLGSFDKNPDEQASLPDGATALLDLYINEARSLLKNKSTSFFGWNCADGINDAFKSIGLEALGREVTPHAFRYLIATWCKRCGISVDEAAAILLHLPATTQKVYDKTNAIDEGRRTNAAVKQLFGKIAA